MNIDINNYKIKQGKENNIMISFEIKTKKIELLTLCSFYYDKKSKSLIIDYWLDKTLSFSYVLRNIPSKLLKLILRKDIILISEENVENDLIVVLEQEDFHYECINSKHLN